MRGRALRRKLECTFGKADKALVLSYTFTYEGNPIDALIRLTPGAEGKMGAQAEFAGGAYVMTGSAAKKEKAK